MIMMDSPPDLPSFSAVEAKQANCWRKFTQKAKMLIQILFDWISTKCMPALK